MVESNSGGKIDILARNWNRKILLCAKYMFDNKITIWLLT